MQCFGNSNYTNVSMSVNDEKCSIFALHLAHRQPVIPKCIFVHILPSSGTNNKNFIIYCSKGWKYLIIFLNLRKKREFVQDYDIIMDYKSSATWDNGFPDEVINN